MSYKSIGSLVLLALAGCGGGSGGGSPPPPPPPPLAAIWSSQHRVPTSSHLRGVRFIDANLGYVAGEATSILMTTDGGATWAQQEHAPVSRGGDIAAMDGGPGSLRCAGSDASGGRWWDTSDGLQWSTPDVGSTGFAAFTAVDAVSDSVAYYLTSGGAIRFVDGAFESTLNVGAAGPWLAIDFSGTSGTGYVAGAGGQVRKTTNNGASWNLLPTGTANTLRDFSFLTAFVGYACGDGGTVVRTNDGSNWSPSFTSPAAVLRGIHFPVDVNTGWVVGDGGAIFRTINGGTTWVQLVISGFTVNLHDVWFINNSVGWAVGDFGTVIRTVDGGASWAILTQGSLAQFNAVDFTADGVKGLAVGNGGVILRTLDSGQTWTPSASGVTANLLGVAVPRTGSGQVAYACGVGGTILKTVNFGDAWTAQTPVATTLRAILFPAGDLIGYCAGDVSTFLFTPDGGVVWTPNAPPAADYHSLSAPPTGPTVYAAGSGGMVVSTATDGVSWTSVPLGVATLVLSLQSPSASTVFAGAADGNVYRTLTGGAPWTPAAPGAVPNALVFTSAVLGWSAGAGLFYTEDGGLVWTRSFEHTNATLRGIWMNAAGAGGAVGDSGTIIRTATGGK